MSTPYQTAILADSPVAYVPGNETAFPLMDIVRGIPQDAIAYGTGTAGVASTVPLGTYAWGNPGGAAGPAVVFTNPFTPTGTLTLSLEMWINSSSTVGAGQFSTAGVMSDISSGDNDYMLTFQSGMQPGSYLQPAGKPTNSVISASGINDGAWHHIVITWDGSTGANKLYIDGALNAQQINAATTGTVKGQTYWQTGSNVNNWAGSANNWAIYDHVLTPAQVLNHYNIGSGLTATVPDVTLQTVSAATTLLTSAGLLLGAVTTDYSLTVPTGEVISQNPAAGTTAYVGSSVDVVVSLGLPPVLTTVPNVVGDTVGAATLLLTGSNLILGGVLVVFSPTVPAGLITSQSPAAGASVVVGSAVSVIVSKGPSPSIVPDVLGLSAADANTAIINAGFIPAAGDPVVTEAYTIGDVADQSPLGGVIAPQGSTVTYNIAVFLLPFDPDVTVISQYANSPTILRLVENMGQYLDPRANLEAFYNYVWNVDTAIGFGLDIWGAIVGVSRLLAIANTDAEYFGFENGSSGPFDWQNFVGPSGLGGAPFSRGAADTQAYLLPDDAYRTLILTKALSNIVATTAPALNALLLMLFPGRGKVYVEDNGSMTMTFVFEFSLSPVEYAILTQSGALPHPAGVTVNVTVP